MHENNCRHSFLTFPERLERWQWFLPYALLLSVTFALYATSVYFQFVWDDVGYYVEGNYRIQGLSWPRMKAIWTNSYLGHYAPIHHTFLAIVNHFSGMEPFGYHLSQLLLHAACVCLLYFVLKKIESARIALLATLLFVVHPTNIETVAWVSETKSTLAFLFFLLSFWALIRLNETGRWRYLALCATFLIVSVLAKINTVVAPASFLLYEYWKGYRFDRQRVWSLAGLFLVSGIFVLVHLASFHGSASVLENAYYGGLRVHLQNLPFLVLFYIRMTVFPHPLSAWHMFRIYEHFTWQIGLAWLAMLLILWLLYRSDRRIRFWLLWFLVFLAPVLQIVPFPIWVAERYLYIPAIGLFVLGSGFFFWSWDRLAPPWRQLAVELVIGAILLVFAWQAHSYLPVWTNDLTLWEATAPGCMSSPYCHNNLGLALLRSGQTEQGMRELIRAVEIRSAPDYLARLADAYTFATRDYRQALIAYNMAVEQGDSHVSAELYAKLARAYLLAGQGEQAERAIQAGWKIDANDPTLLVINGILQWKLGNLEESRRSLRRVLMITGQSSNPAGFIGHYWGDPAEIGRLIADLRSSQPANGSSQSRAISQK